MLAELNSCDTIPLHLIGCIQRTGYLLALQCVEQELIIVAVSDNVSDAEWASVKDVQSLIGKSLMLLLHADCVDVLKKLINKFDTFVRQPLHAVSIKRTRAYTLLRLLCHGSPFTCLNAETGLKSELSCSVVAADETTYLIELEDACSEPQQMMPGTNLLQIGGVLGKIRACDHILSTVKVVCESVLDRCTAYDRGMVYRFCDDLSGEVIHENIRDGANKVDSSYLGLRFPAGDIPASARRLYLANGLRFVADIEQPDAVLYGTALPDGQKLDLSMSCLRGCATVHKQYLANMGVRASLSVAIVVHNKLWGLYVFHSYGAPFAPSVEQRIAFELTGSISAMQITGIIDNENSQRKLNLTSALSPLLSSKSLYKYLTENHAQILSSMRAECIAVCDQCCVVASYGQSELEPTSAGIEKLNLLCHNDSMLALTSFEDGLSSSGCGVAYFKFSTMSIAVVRASCLRDVHWGGKPDKTRTSELTGLLDPRSSFDAYLEKNRHESKPWTEFEHELLDIMAKKLLSFVHSETLRSFELVLEKSAHERLDSLKSAQENYDYFAHMSHELRTPFHGVMGSLEILLDNSISPQERTDVVVGALECGNGLLRTLDAILDVAKSKHAMHLRTEPFNLSSILRELYGIMQPLAQRKHVNFEIPTHKSCSVLGDRTRVLQVLNNFVNNALKFTAPAGTVLVNLHIGTSYQQMHDYWTSTTAGYSAHYWSTAEGEVPSPPNIWSTEQCDQSLWCYFEVKDTAMGIKQNEMERVLLPYTQLSSGASKEHQGTGLGLYLCLSNAQCHGGCLGIASTEGVGSVFSMLIPLLPQERHTATVTGNDLAAGKSTLAPAAPEALLSTHIRRVLIVDDSPLNIRLCQRKLMVSLTTEAQFLTASTGLEAVLKYKQLVMSENKQIHAIIMDYYMPEMNGRDAIIEIRRLEKQAALQAVPIVAFTADASEIVRALLLSAGASAVLTKPTAPGELEGTVLHMLASWA